MPRSEQPTSLILDTHAWVGFFAGDPDYAKSPARKPVDDAALTDKLSVCAISVWEVAMLQSKGRLHLGSAVLDWVEQALGVSGAELIPLTARIAVDSTRLPGGEYLHFDPADRIIAASARLLGATVVTRDRGLLDYARRGFVRAMRA